MHRQLVLISLIFFTLSTNVFAEGMSVAFTGAEIRTAPSSMSSKVILKVDKHYPLTVNKQGPEYYQVSDYRGRNGFIHKSLLKPQPAVIVTGDRANVRSGPSTSQNVVFQLSQGETARLMSSSDGWLEIETATGQKGWIAEFLVWGE